MAFKQRTPDDHPLRWGDAELAYMVERSRRPDGKIGNIATIYRFMGYDGAVVSPAFKRRIEKLRKGQGNAGN